MDLAELIAWAIDNHPAGLKASQIARMIGTTRHDVNSYLYSHKSIYEIDANYVWKRKTAVSVSKGVSEKKPSAPLKTPTPPAPKPRPISPVLAKPAKPLFEHGDTLEIEIEGIRYWGSVVFYDESSKSVYVMYCKRYNTEGKADYDFIDLPAAAVKKRTPYEPTSVHDGNILSLYLRIKVSNLAVLRIRM